MEHSGAREPGGAEELGSTRHASRDRARDGVRTPDPPHDHIRVPDPPHDHIRVPDPTHDHVRTPELTHDHIRAPEPPREGIRGAERDEARSALVPDRAPAGVAS
ncbi:hypothetical protein [Streptomyces sp. NPDC053720]|uniref:hypothetical protein n=1 Tax=Streptomyces sp. NPDC053720 TaxID=3154855 RepID=UPI0034196FCA